MPPQISAQCAAEDSFPPCEGCETVNGADNRYYEMPSICGRRFKVNQQQATITVTVLTAIGACAGVGYLVANSGRRCSHSSSTRSLSSSLYGATGINIPMETLSGSRSSSTSFTSSFPSSYYSYANSPLAEFPSESLSVEQPAIFRSKKQNTMKSTLTGVLRTMPVQASAAKGSFTAFVQAPDGTTTILGRVSLSSSSRSDLHFGPFDQNGTYAFGITLNEGALLPTSTTLASVDILVDAHNVQCFDFTLPANAQAGYTSSLHYFEMDPG